MTFYIYIHLENIVSMEEKAIIFSQVKRSLIPERFKMREYSSEFYSCLEVFPKMVLQKAFFQHMRNLTQLKVTKCLDQLVVERFNENTEMSRF